MTLPSLPELKRLQAEATPGEWEPYEDEWEEEDSDGTIHHYRQCGVIGGLDGILDTKPAPTLIDAPNEYDPVAGLPAEHNNMANVTVAALAPALLAEVIRLLEGLAVYIHEMDCEIRELYRNHQQSDKADALDEVADDLTRILGDTE